MDDHAVVLGHRSAARVARWIEEAEREQRLTLAGNDPSEEGAEVFGARIRREREVVAQIVRETGIKAE